MWFKQYPHVLNQHQDLGNFIIYWEQLIMKKLENILIILNLYTQ